MRMNILTYAFSQFSAHDKSFSRGRSLRGLPFTPFFHPPLRSNTPLFKAGPLSFPRGRGGSSSSSPPPKLSCCLHV